METYVRNEAVAVTATSGQVADTFQGRGGRVNIVLRNTSPNAIDIISINLGVASAVAGTGIVLRQNEVWGDSNDSGYQCWQDRIQAVCATANGTLSIMER